MSVTRAFNRAGLAACLLLGGSVGMQQASALSDTRTLTLHHVHTDEDLTVTYKKNGQYDEEALKKINWIMRDWRKNESVTMDREEIDLLWEVYQEVGAKEAIHIICGYRSPATNSMLRNRSSGVARNSQHTLGKAIDFYIPGVPLDKLRATAMRLQGGGVGFYPTSGSPFVHLDIGNVRAWPRMSREQLVKLFPDGRTVHLPASGDPLPGYELAKADLERGINHRGVGEPKKRTFLASLFGRDKDAEEGDDSVSARESAPAKRGVTAKQEAAQSETAKSETTKPATPAAARYQIASIEPVASAPPPQFATAQAVPMPPRRPAYQVAEARPEPAPAPRAAAPIQVASLSANDIINMRGLWDNTGNALAATPETNALSVSSARRLSPGRDVTASLGGLPSQDRVPAEVALAYAAQQADAKSGARVAPAVVTSRGLTSVVSKPVEAMAQSRPVKPNERLDDPWLRGLVLAPSVQNSLVVTQVGEPDLAGLTQFMKKPGSSVLMTFSNDPHLGMTDAQFSGSAVVFPATMTFGPARRTASLQ